MADESDDSQSEPAWLATAKRVGILALIAGTAVWIIFIAANHLAKGNARNYVAEGRVLWSHEVAGKVRAAQRPHSSGARGWSRDGVGILLDGRDDPIEYTRPRPSKLSDLAPGDRVRVSYSEGAFALWRHFRVRDVQKLAGSAR